MRVSARCVRSLLGWAAVTTLCAGAGAATGAYREPFANSFPIRQRQHLQIKAYADKLLKEQSDHALRSVEPDFSSIEAYERSLQPFRDRLKAFYGTPPPGAKEGRVTARAGVHRQGREHRGDRR